LLDNVTVQPLKDLTRGTPLAFLLGVGNLSRDFTCRPFTTPPPSDELGYLELHPNSSIPGLAYIQLGVDPATSAIRALRMVDTAGNVRQVRFAAMRLGVTFPPKYFIFEIEEGMEVITK
jgi:outer membrane lipoprotein-sorting protein